MLEKLIINFNKTKVINFLIRQKLNEEEEGTYEKKNKNIVIIIKCCSQFSSFIKIIQTKCLHAYCRPIHIFLLLKTFRVPKYFHFVQMFIFFFVIHLLN